MTMDITYTPQGVCSREMHISAEEGLITKVNVVGGCNGNNQGICRLLVGMKLTEAISRLEGIKCGSKSSSCPDQLSIAMKKML